MAEPARFLSARSVAEMFDVSPPTVRRWEERGVIKPVEIGGLKRYDVAGLLKAAGAALDERSGRRARSADPDEVLQEMGREGRKAAAR